MEEVLFLMALIGLLLIGAVVAGTVIGFSV